MDQLMNIMRFNKGGLNIQLLTLQGIYKQIFNKTRKGVLK